MDESALQTKREALFRDLATLRELPPAPRTLDDVWRVLGQESSSATALADVLQRDAALTAKVLRLANSAYYGLPRPVSEVRAACLVLGFDTIRALSVGVTVLDSLSKSVSESFDLDAFWRHSVGVATAAQAIARRAQMDAGTAFCAGILHDLGKLMLASLAPARWRKLATAGTSSAESAEVTEFGASHAEVGAWIGARWHFPVELIEAIREHHTPASAAGRWGALIRLADGMAHRGKCPSPGPGTPAAAEPALLARVPIEAEAFAAIENAFSFSLERVEAFTEAARSAS